MIPWKLTDGLGINALFASAVLCIMISTLRAAQITANTINTDADTDGTWLAVWGMAECAVGTSAVLHSTIWLSMAGNYRWQCR